MKVMVVIKRVADYHIQVNPSADGMGVDLTGVKMGINPFDENAIEAALRLRESNHAGEIVAVTFGPANHQDVLRQALAMGVDRVILVESNNELQPLSVAKMIKVLVEKEAPALVILGKQAIDDDAGQTAQMLAGLLGWSQGIFVSDITVNHPRIQINREVDGGIESLELTLPAVISADLRLNSPRFVKLPNLMLAKKKPIETISAVSLGVDIAPRLKVLKVTLPSPRKPVVLLNSVAELVEKLRNEAGVLS
jgi:electron transfer flavoprotein beta subunit